MKTLFSLCLAVFALTTVPVLAEETVSEKAEAIVKDVQRGVNKAVNRVEEVVCTDTEAACLAKKAKNRAEETATAVTDKAVEEKKATNPDPGYVPYKQP